MRFSQLYAPTVKEAPADAEVVSHALLYRAGFIRKAAAGVYTYLPLAKRTLSKIENIVREEMNKIGAQEISMPIIHPAELWQMTGRWDDYGKIVEGTELGADRAEDGGWTNCADTKAHQL